MGKVTLGIGVTDKLIKDVWSQENLTKGKNATESNEATERLKNSGLKNDIEKYFARTGSDSPWILSSEETAAMKSFVGTLRPNDVISYKELSYNVDGDALHKAQNKYRVPLDENTSMVWDSLFHDDKNVIGIKFDKKKGNLFNYFVTTNVARLYSNQEVIKKIDTFLGTDNSQIPDEKKQQYILELFSLYLEEKVSQGNKFIKGNEYDLEAMQKFIGQACDEFIKNPLSIIESQITKINLQNVSDKNKINSHALDMLVELHASAYARHRLSFTSEIINTVVSNPSRPNSLNEFGSSHIGKVLSFFKNSGLIHEKEVMACLKSYLEVGINKDVWQERFERLQLLFESSPLKNTGSGIVQTIQELDEIEALFHPLLKVVYKKTATFGDDTREGRVFSRMLNETLVREFRNNQARTGAEKLSAEKLAQDIAATLVANTPSQHEKMAVYLQGSYSALKYQEIAPKLLENGLDDIDTKDPKFISIFKDKYKKSQPKTITYEDINGKEISGWIEFLQVKYPEFYNLYKELK